MSATLATLPPLWLDSEFRLSFGPVAGEVFTSRPLKLTVTSQATLTRYTLTQTDAAFAEGGTIVTFVKPAAWVAANLTGGWLECHFYVDSPEAHFAAVRFFAATPAGGRIAP